MSSLQLFPATQLKHPMFAQPRRAARPNRLGGIGTALFFFTITSVVIGGGVAGLRYGDPDRWDPPAHGEQNATRPEAIAPVMAAALPDAPVVDPAPPAEPAKAAPTKRAPPAPKAKAKTKPKTEAPRAPSKPVEADPFATAE